MLPRLRPSTPCLIADLWHVLCCAMHARAYPMRCSVGWRYQCGVPRGLQRDDPRVADAVCLWKPKGEPGTPAAATVAQFLNHVATPRHEQALALLMANSYHPLAALAAVRCAAFPARRALGWPVVTV